jgi:hypothetical protein
MLCVVSNRVQILRVVICNVEFGSDVGDHELTLSVVGHGLLPNENACRLI